MKLILTQEVPGLGAAGDVVEVKDGYGRNYLLPRGFATAWTKGAARQIEQMRAARQAREIASVDQARALRDRIQAQVFVLRQRAGDTGRLFGAVSAADIAAVLSALAWTNGASEQAAATRAFTYGAAQLKMIETPLALLPDGIAALELLDHALDRLAAASLPIKKRTLIAAAHVIGHDGTITPEEDELFRAISAALDVPLPAAA